MGPEDLQNMSSEEILELQKKNCIFCKIISKEIPSKEIYEDEKVFVILDINPASEGHCLILPKQHYQILPQIPDDLISHMSVVAKKASRSLLKSLGIKGTTIFIANGAIAGQKAPHFMMHVIPRKPGDMLFQMVKKAIPEKELQDVHVKLSQRVSGKKVKHTPESSAVKHIEVKKPGEHKNEQHKVSDAVQKPESNDKFDLDQIADLFK